MSFFLAYFESRNKSSRDFDGFAEVGNFSIPEGLLAGDMHVSLGGRNYISQLVADHSKQSANNFFRKEGDELRKELFIFLERRLSNTCVIANLVGYVMRSEIGDLQIASLRETTFNEFKKQFDRKLFENGVGVRLIGR